MLSRQRSSNVGTYHVAEKVGRTELYKFFNLFGFCLLYTSDAADE